MPELGVFDLLKLIEYALKHDNPGGALALVESVLAKNDPEHFFDHDCQHGTVCVPSRELK